jgi:uncharacterized C2H2 Zn-finger protein
VPFVEYDEVEAVCPDCGMIFRSEEALDHHRDEVHVPVPAALPARGARRRSPPGLD